MGLGLTSKQNKLKDQHCEGMLNRKALGRRGLAHNAGSPAGAGVPRAVSAAAQWAVPGQRQNNRTHNDIICNETGGKAAGTSTRRRGRSCRAAPSPRPRVRGQRRPRKRPGRAGLEPGLCPEPHADSATCNCSSLHLDPSSYSSYFKKESSLFNGNILGLGPLEASLV